MRAEDRFNADSQTNCIRPRQLDRKGCWITSIREEPRDISFDSFIGAQTASMEMPTYSGNAWQVTSKNPFFFFPPLFFLLLIFPLRTKESIERVVSPAELSSWRPTDCAIGFFRVEVTRGDA